MELPFIGVFLPVKQLRSPVTIYVYRDVLLGMGRVCTQPCVTRAVMIYTFFRDI